MPCCHADFAAVEGSDRGFTVGMPTFTFGSGVLAEAGPNARELGLGRVALFTDRRLAPGPYVAAVRASLAAAGVDVAVYDEVVIEPTDESFQHAARFAVEGRFDGYVSVGGGSVMDTCKAANLYATHPAEFMAYVNAPIGAGGKVPGAVRPHIACPTTAGTGSETTGIAIFNLRSMNAKTGIISRRLIPTVALVDPDVTASLPKNAVAATGFDCMSHALEAITARAFPRRANPAKGIDRPVSQGANPFSDMLAAEALKSVGRFLVRAVADASDTEARTEMMYAAMLAGIAFNASGCHLPHGLSYAVSGLAKDWHVDGYPEGKSLVPHGMAVVLNNPSVWRYTAPCCPERHLHGAHCLGARVDGAKPEDAGEVLAGRVIELMRATGMPNGLNALGFDDSHLEALTRGAEPQYRVIKNAPKDVPRDDLTGLFRAALRYW
jgi:alcohol dehydrogenase class IV